MRPTREGMDWNPADEGDDEDLTRCDTCGDLLDPDDHDKATMAGAAIHGECHTCWEKRT